MIPREINKAIEKEYETRRRAAERLAQERTEELYAKLPETRAIDRRINSLGILIGYAAMKRRRPRESRRIFRSAVFLWDRNNSMQKSEGCRNRKKRFYRNPDIPAIIRKVYIVVNDAAIRVRFLSTEGIKTVPAG